VRIGRDDVPISNPDKLFFPERGLTKGDLVAYYQGVADHALPHLRRRPFHMKRFPNGVEGEFFHQKRVPAKHPAYVDDVHVSFPSGHSTVFAIVDNAAALAWVTNLGCIELHTWHSRVPEIERPDYLLIDLDPTSDGQWPFVREIALVARKVLDELKLRSYPKTSGATGLHILCPIKPELAFPEVRRLAKAIAVEVERRDDHLAGRRPRRRVRRLRAERPGPNHRIGVVGAADARRTCVGTASLGRGRRGRSGRLHGRNDACAGRCGRRPDARDVAESTVARGTFCCPGRTRTECLRELTARSGQSRTVDPVRRLLLLLLLALTLAGPSTASASPYVQYGLQDDAWLESGPGTTACRTSGSTSSG